MSIGWILPTRRRPRGVVALGATTMVVFLSGAGARPAPVRHGAVSDHVIVISLDGMRPDALMKYGGSTLERLAREGTYSIDAQTIFPSKTLPSHTSMLTGQPPERHGITWNSDETDEVGEVAVPTVFEVAKSAGYTTAAFFSKSKFHHLQKPGTLDYTQAPEGGDKWMATRTVGDVINYLHHERPNLLFVHIAETDYAGHSFGWMSFAYKWAVKRADAGVAAVMKAADGAYGKGNYTMIVTADHGGHDRNHGSLEPVDMTIPWIAWGQGVQPGLHIGAGVRTMDTAATVLWLLGVNEPGDWAGRPVAAAYTESAKVAAETAVGRHVATAAVTIE